jgi:hypothetical protein
VELRAIEARHRAAGDDTIVEMVAAIRARCDLTRDQPVALSS